MTAVYHIDQIRTLETLGAEQVSQPLMILAGQAVADWVRSHIPTGNRILCVAGQGNNGGDALVAGRLLQAAGYEVDMVLLGDPAHLPTDAARALQAWQATDRPWLRAMPVPLPGYRLVIDGLFGIGLNRPLDQAWCHVIDTLNKLAAPKLALDIPSGLCARTGTILGNAIMARWTISFIALKPGLLTHEGPDHAGEVIMASLGMDAPMLLPPAGRALHGADVAGLLVPRRRNCHKGLFGSVGVVGGAAGMVGAALLAGRAALKLGAGRVTLGLLDQDAPRVDHLQPEMMLRHAEDLFHLDHLTCLVVGPGLGKSADAVHVLDLALRRPLPLVLDADALNLIADKPDLATQLATRRDVTVLTPHPAEAARMLGCSTAEVQSDRLQAASTLVDHFGADVILKGCGSICMAHDGAWCINTSGNPGLANGGQGDVLAGMAVALLAQGLNGYDAAQLAVYLHGAAADKLVNEGIGPVGLTASEVIDAARAVLRGLAKGWRMETGNRHA
ncbi:NAD(P)H-hydrate dehydratase [Chitinivorax sp. B]|uniref:NAD(P)H-hydrate dehydratase n=1 Tax=Chitinivorax sp. B TaxID=2502235 RepID=UPI0010F85CEA|nr:NAD(P)H-hydrate dehydratase [Chitinivorax sp. B]